MELLDSHPNLVLTPIILEVEYLIHSPQHDSAAVFGTLSQVTVQLEVSDYTPHYFLVAEHGVCFACSCLALAEDACIDAVQHVEDGLTALGILHVFLLVLWAEYRTEVELFDARSWYIHCNS